MGAHGSLGALLFGAALSGLPYQLRQDIVPGMRSAAEGLFVPLFFASAGLHLSLSFTDLPIVTILALVSIPLAGKFAGSLIGAFVSRLEMPFALATGLMAKGVAEIAVAPGAAGNRSHWKRCVFPPRADHVRLHLIGAVGNQLCGKPHTTVGKNHPAGHDTGFHWRVSPWTTLPSTTFWTATRSYPKPQLSVRNFVDQWIIPQQHDYLVVENGTVSGIVSLGMLRYLPKEAWSNTRLESVVRRKTPLARPDEPVEDVLQRMTENSLTIIPVVEEESEEFLGMVTSQDVLDLITLDARGAH